MSAAALQALQAAQSKARNSNPDNNALTADCMFETMSKARNPDTNHVHDGFFRRLTWEDCDLQWRLEVLELEDLVGHHRRLLGWAVIDGQRRSVINYPTYDQEVIEHILRAISPD